MLLLQQMIVLFILMLIGYIARKINIINLETCKRLSGIVVNIANPALILSGSVNSENPVSGNELLMTVGIAVIIFAALILISMLMVTLLRIPSHSCGVYKVMTIFSNVGFMGFPVIQALYGSDALLYASLFLIPYNLLIYTYGISAMTCSGHEKASFSWKNVFNIGVITCIISVSISILQIPMPQFVKTSVSSLSNLTAPLSMMVIGASMLDIDLKKLFTDVRLLLFSGIKLLVIPIAGVLLLELFIKNDMILGVCMVMLATPVGSMTAMLAQQYDGDYELASRGVALTTILSVITMPIVSMFVK